MDLSEVATLVCLIVCAGLIPSLGWMVKRSVYHGERISRLEGDHGAVVAELRSLREAVDKRFSELRSDIKELVTELATARRENKGHSL